MFFGAMLAACLSAQPDSGFERFKLFMSSSPAFEMKGQMTLNQHSPVAIDLRWQKGQDQIYRFGNQFEMRQTDEALVAINHQEKMYLEYRGLRYPMPPDATSYFEETLAYPWYLTDFAEASKQMSGQGWKFDADSGSGWRITGSWHSGFSMEAVEFFLNEQAQPKKMVRTIKTDEGEFVITHTFDYLRAVPAFETPSLHAAPGYLPQGLPKFYTPAPGGKLTAHPLIGTDGKTADLASLMGGKGAVLLFTSPDCDVSAASAPELAKLKSDVEKKGYPMVEISLGSAAPAKAFSGARLFHDASQNLERRWAIPTTPYMVCIDKESQVIGAWEGWWAGCLLEALKSLTETEIEE